MAAHYIRYLLFYCKSFLFLPSTQQSDRHAGWTGCRLEGTGQARLTALACLALCASAGPSRDVGPSMNRRPNHAPVACPGPGHRRLLGKHPETVKLSHHQPAACEEASSCSTLSPHPRPPTPDPPCPVLPCPALPCVPPCTMTSLDPARPGGIVDSRLQKLVGRHFSVTEIYSRQVCSRGVMFRPGTRKWVPLIESHAARYRANQAALSVPDTLCTGRSRGRREPALSLGCTFPTAVHLQWKEAARWLAPPHRCGSLAVLSPAHPQEAAPFGVGLLVMSSPDRLTGRQID